MCLRDRPWLLTRTSPLAPPQFSLVVMTRSLRFPGQSSVSRCGFGLRRGRRTLVFLDGLAHDNLRFAACITVTRMSVRLQVLGWRSVPLGRVEEVDTAIIRLLHARRREL
jgi:hypothetical protein